jgi:branched-chain amino acid transport system ATP-binding protein
MADALLRIENVDKSFGGLKAINSVSFVLEAGQLLGLIGPNGAGKTTIFNMVSGIYRVDRGRIYFDGHDITNERPARIAQRGIARTFQVPRTFNDMSVEENLLVPTVRMRLSARECQERVNEMIESLGLGNQRFSSASELSGGERQLLQFARAVISRPKLLILDEPFAGASQTNIDLMIAMTSELARSGVGCLVISHDIVSLPRLCDDVVVMSEGAILTSGRLSQIREDAQVIEAYLGA